MNLLRRFARSLIDALEISGRRQVLPALKGMDPRLLKDMGLSPELLQKGVDAWPWRAEALNENGRAPSNKRTRLADSGRNEPFDVELTDLAISRA